jgi:hypothetical protein
MKNILVYFALTIALFNNSAYLCGAILQQQPVIHSAMKNVTAYEAAIQMVIMDAMEKGHTDKTELIAYMASKTFEAAVERYAEMFKELL